jgi:hypothetical protein
MGEIAELLHLLSNRSIDFLTFLTLTSDAFLPFDYHKSNRHGFEEKSSFERAKISLKSRVEILV